jgi:hypothetical protein
MPIEITFNASDPTSASRAEALNMTIQIEQPRLMVSNATSLDHTFSDPQNVSFLLTNINLTTHQDTMINQVLNHSDALHTTLLNHIVNL